MVQRNFQNSLRNRNKEREGNKLSFQYTTARQKVNKSQLNLQ